VHCCTGGKRPPETPQWIYPKTRAILQEMTGTDVTKGRYLRGAFLGLDMKTPKAIDFINTYYTLADLGTPFLSCFPDEFVFSAIVGKVDPAVEWQPYPFWKLVDANSQGDSSAASMDAKRKEGLYFYWRQH